MTLSEQLKSLVEKATPGPWEPHDYVPGGGSHVMIWDTPTQRRLMCIECVSRANASLIVTLVNNLPTILAALEAVENTHD